MDCAVTASELDVRVLPHGGHDRRGRAQFAGRIVINTAVSSGTTATITCPDTDGF
jgi:hypothetical protein